MKGNTREHTSRDAEATAPWEKQKEKKKNISV